MSNVVIRNMFAHKSAWLYPHMRTHLRSVRFRATRHEELPALGRSLLARSRGGGAHSRLGRLSPSAASSSSCCRRYAQSACDPREAPAGLHTRSRGEKGISRLAAALSLDAGEDAGRSQAERRDPSRVLGAVTGAARAAGPADGRLGISPIARTRPIGMRRAVHHRTHPAY